jgi:hypothetical protein
VTASLIELLKSVLVAWFQGIPDFLAFRTHREPFRVAAGHPHLATECHNRRAHHHGLGQLVLGHVVGEALMIALLNAILSLLLGALIDDGLGAGTWLLTHVGQSRQRTRRGVSAREEGSSS